MAFALVSGFGVLVFGWLLPPLAGVFGACCDGSLWLLQSCVETARRVPWSHFWVPGPADWWLCGFYGGLALVAAFPALRPPRRWCVALAAGWTAVGFAPSVLRSPAGRLECTFLSVGHGCSVLLELPSGQTMLYDAGHMGSPELGARSVAACLWSRGITHLDALVLSHADADHYNMVPELLDRFSVGAVYVSPVMFERENRAMLALRKAIDEAKVPVREVFSGDLLQAGEGCRIDVLHPPRRGVIGEDNANSVVLAIEYLGRRILLPGDLESPGLEDVLAERPWDCDVLLAPHHGSRSSNPPGLAEWCSPEWVVVSGSLDSYQAETRATYRAANAEVLHTGEAGAISVRIDARGMVVEPFRPRGGDRRI
jgi:competence protein ComEC